MIRTTNGTRSGFFFAVMALAMLSLVLMTVQVWVKTFEQSDYRASQRFKGEAVRSILTSLSDKTLADFANASAYYATHKLVNYTSDLNNLGLGNTLPSNDPRNPDTGIVNKTIFELMLNGTSEPNAGRPITYSLEENTSYTLSGWQGKIDAAANAMGFDINFSDVKNFSYRQLDAWTVGISFDMDMDIADVEGTMRQNKTMHAESNFSISGFLDPMITRKDMVRSGQWELATKKQIFKNGDYNVSADVAPRLLHDYPYSWNDGTGPEGNGWFFGPITSDTPDEISPLATEPGVTLDNLKQYALVHPYNTSNGSIASFADSYGAVIVTTSPVIVNMFDAGSGCNYSVQTKCLNCMRKRQQNLPSCTEGIWETFSNNNNVNVPVIVVNNWNTANVTPVTTEQIGGPKTERFVLIDNGNEDSSLKREGYHRVWDITKLRDMAICGFYVKGIGPSFFQRMQEGAESISNPQLGIESFVIGQWAGGAIDQSRDINSRLDWEFYKGVTGNNVPKIKGMMGCKSKEMCKPSNLNATQIGVGKFRLSNDAITRYLSTNISCPAATQSAPCD